MKTLHSATMSGLDAIPVEVEATFTKGLPAFSIVGLPNSTIQESRDRIKSALQTIGFKFPPLKITVNLSPSDEKKEGGHFDLPIALLIALQKESFESENLFVFGELGLGGKLKDCHSIYPIILSLVQNNRLHKALVPHDSLEKLSMIPNLQLYGAETLEQAIGFLKGDTDLASQNAYAIASDTITLHQQTYYHQSEYPEDFADVKGQSLAKRAALIAAAGFHNILLEGSPGCGKSMISKRMQYILPPMDHEEILNIAKIDSLNGKQPEFKPIRPYRHPHHTSTKASIFGGGSNQAQIGEVALANKGILFFDELPHFPKTVLEALREPLEDGVLQISRVNNKVEYETDILFIGAQNPCPCGNLLSKVNECRCSDLEIQRYKNKLSEPFLDRIDLHIQMHDISPDDQPDTDSKTLHTQVITVFEAQKARGQNNLNGKMREEEIEKYCILDTDTKEALDKAILRFGLSQRGINKLKKISRTIADLDQSEVIMKKHLLEALSYRMR